MRNRLTAGVENRMWEVMAGAHWVAAEGLVPAAEGLVPVEEGWVPAAVGWVVAAVGWVVAAGDGASGSFAVVPPHHTEASRMGRWGCFPLRSVHSRPHPTIPPLGGGVAQTGGLKSRGVGAKCAGRASVQASQAAVEY